MQEEIAGEILDKLRPRLSGDEKKRRRGATPRTPRPTSSTCRAGTTGTRARSPATRARSSTSSRPFRRTRSTRWRTPGWPTRTCLLGSYWVEAITEAKAAAEQALELDPTLAEAHVALGQIKLWLDWDWPAARREFKQGIALNPASALAHNQYAMYLATVGRVSDAIAEVRRALELDPLSPIVNSDLGWYLLFAGQHAEAIAQFRKTLEFDSNSVSAHRGSGIALSEAGQHDEAITELKRALAAVGEQPGRARRTSARRTRAPERKSGRATPC